MLAHEGIAYGKHTAVRAALNRALVKTGKIRQYFGDYYNKLFDDRLAGDYEPSTAFSRDELEKLLETTKQFIAVCSRSINF